MPCKLDATEISMHILIYFSKGVLNMWLLSIHSCLLLKLWSSLVCHLSALLLLQNISWQIVYMLFNFAKVVVVDPCMLWTCSCNCLAPQICLLTVGCLAMPFIALWWVVQAHQHAYLLLFLPCMNLYYNLPCLMCAFYEVDVYMCFGLCHAIFTEVLIMYFCDQCGD